MIDGPISLEHAVRTVRQRSKWRVRDDAAQARHDLAELMAEGCPTITAAAQRMGISLKRAHIHWQAIRRGLDAASRVPGGGQQTV